MFWILLILTLLLFCLIYWKLKQNQEYWTIRHVNQFKPKYMFENMIGMIFGTKSFADSVYETYNCMGSNERYVGSYQLLEPFLVVKDPKLLVEMFIKNFDHFTDHREMLPDKVEPLWIRNLLNLQKDEWKQMRATLSPAFTSSKMKNMFIFMSECAQQFVEHCNKTRTSEVLDLKDVFTRYTNDVIASCAFGVECNSFKDPSNDFYLMGKKITNFRGFKKAFVMVFPRFAHKLGLTFFDKQASSFFTKIISDAIKFREENNTIRPDMLHLLLQAQKGTLKHEENKGVDDSGFSATEDYSNEKLTQNKKFTITDIDIMAQALIFFTAGFESISNMLVFAAYELAIHPDIQDRLIEEIDETVRENDGKEQVTYQALNKMKFLDNIISETLRKYPAIAGTDRICVKPYTIEPVEEHEKPVHINVGDTISIPIYGLNYDPNYFPEPDRFDPDRFSDERKGTIVPNTFLTFGIGPRNCIGSRFALIEAKTILFKIFLHFKLLVCEKTPIPLPLEKTGFITTAKGSVWVELVRRNKSS